MVPVRDYVAPPLDDIPRHLDYMMGSRMSELNVAEGMAIVLCETPDMPWSFYLDIARHCWDETRHSLFGEAAIEHTYGDRAAIPMRDYEGIFAMEASPLEQYTVLGLEVEGKNMKYPPPTPRSEHSPKLPMKSCNDGHLRLKPDGRIRSG